MSAGAVIKLIANDGKAREIVCHGNFTGLVFEKLNASDHMSNERK